MNNNIVTNKFIDDLCGRDIQVQVFLMNGIKLEGSIVSFDDESILLYSGKTQLVARQVISTLQEK